MRLVGALGSGSTTRIRRRTDVLRTLPDRQGSRSAGANEAGVAREVDP